ncbi:restriction endonuclease subunit S [Stutzerimonas xanthomarina]|uniref:Restriction endonuclease subunit S n=1 Tax=Stutzerimonas xanthomarina TaxID=271420 RepID=A0A3R8UUC5_9GAMM|nr:restriction endonuclease subunit S [Stutzerimonas xanthomarina]RRV03846.1 restriction endonuclease subunit S [Stutzerimonas xanthomarina]
MSAEVLEHSLASLCLLVADCPHATPEWTASGVVVLRNQNIKGGRLDLSAPSFTDEAHYLGRIRRAAPQEGDLVITREAPMGEVCQIPAGLKCCLGQRQVLLRPDPEKVDSRFLLYALQSPYLQHQIGWNEGTGSTVSNLRIPVLEALKVPTPSVATQREVASVLGALDDRITLLRETNTTLEAIAQALFKSWFIDFDPVRAKAEGRQPEGMDATTAALFPDSFEESELGLVPKGWRYGSLKEVTAIFDSQRVPLSGQERDKRKGIYPYYGAAALMDWVDGYLFDGVYLLLGEDGSVADAAGYPVTQYVWGKIWVNNHAHVLQGKSGVTTEHLMLALQQTIITPYITGAVQAKLSQSNMWRIPFLRSSQEVSEAFGEAVTPLFISIRRNYEQAQTLTQLRDTLLPRLIAGQLRLPEVQALLNDRDTAQ